MGSKITIDSSTLMNKAFEIIEAYYIFGVEPNKIRVLIERNSYVHSFICLKDGTYKLSVGKPDMRIQIKDALNLIELDEKHEFPDTEINTFDKYKFYPVDKEKFPLIDYGYYVIGHKRLSGLILNDADEICYKYFKEGVISYLDIKKVIDKKYIIDAYIPDVYGKERRKSSFSKERKIGVEGLDKDTIIKCINIACNTLKNLDKRKYISKLDLYNLNLVGCKNSSINRSRLIKFLNAPENISTNGLVNLLNSLMDYEEFMNIYKRLFEKS